MTWQTEKVLRWILWIVGATALFATGWGCAVLDESEPTPTAVSSGPRFPPSPFGVADRTSHSLTIAWAGPIPQANENPPTYYDLQRSLSEDGDYSDVAAGIASTEFVDREVKPDSIYYYKVRACNSLGCSPWSSVTGGVTESTGAVSIPEAPAFLIAEKRIRSLGETLDFALEAFGEPGYYLAIIWTGVQGATYYEIYRDSKLLAKMSAQEKGGYTGGFSGADSSARLYQVRACNKEGCSPFASPLVGRGLPGPATMMLGVCEIGLILNPEEFCWLEDSGTFLFAEAEADRTGYYDMCLQKEHGSICQGEFVEISEYLVAQQLEEPKKQWIIRPHPMSPKPLPQTEGWDSVAGDTKRYQTGKVSFASISPGAWYTCGVSAEAGSVACWGDNDYGEASPLGGEFISVSAGGGYTCGVRVGGSLACWGPDWFGDLTICKRKTDGSHDCRAAEWNGQAMPPEGLFTSVSVGGSHACGVKTDGAVACWASNEDGRATPPGGAFTYVSAGGHHTCGVKTDGAVACWGSDRYGQATPPEGTFTSVSAGNLYTCGVKTDGAVACWGSDRHGQAMPPEGAFTSVDSGNRHTCAINVDGTATCWGNDSSGQAIPP